VRHINPEKEIIMLTDANILAVLPAKDINRAKDFYRDKLGMEPSDSMEEGSAIYRCGNGTGFLIYQTENAGTAKNTQMGWETDNLEREMEDLRGRGVVFEDYDFPGLKTENGIASNDWGQSAWFLDSEGNILNLSQRT
jgi:catechol 2,3-dioxygenase-like lactoylglutathione lyase family enzyme